MRISIDASGNALCDEAVAPPKKYDKQEAADGGFSLHDAAQPSQTRINCHVNIFIVMSIAGFSSFNWTTRELVMAAEQGIVGFVAILWAGFAFAYGTPETLKAELKEGDDLYFSKDAKEGLSAFTNLSNSLVAPPVKGGEKLPALVVFHTCGGIKQNIRDWTEAALKAGYVVLVPDAMRGLRSDCGSPPVIPNARLIKDALDGVAHLAALPYVDSKRISVVGFSKGALVATWLASSNVANVLRPGTPSIASTVAVYGFCGLGPTRNRPQGVTILQPDTDRPHLMLMGGRDNETPPASCLERLPKLKEAGAPVQWHLYPEATHAWDASDLDGFSKVAYNNERVTYRFDKAVTEDSMKRVFDFLSATGGKN